LSVGDRLISLVGLIPGGAVAKLAKAGASARELARFKKAVAEIDRLRTAAGEIKKFADEARKFETASGEFGKVARKGERSVKKVSGTKGVATESPYITRIDPSAPGRPSPKYSVDTHTFTTGELTSGGGIRNAQEFWQQWRDLQPESLSANNKYLIENFEKFKTSPRIDETWIKVFPEHAAFKGETILHHHVDFGRYAIPVPQSTHVGSGGVWHTK